MNPVGRFLSNCLNRRMGLFNEVDHIAIAVTNLEEALVLYHDILGFQVKEIEEVSEQGVKVAKLMIGCNIIELITPLSESSPIAKFLDKHGPGLHHIALNTDNIEDTMQNLKTKGLQFVGDQ